MKPKKKAPPKPPAKIPNKTKKAVPVRPRAKTAAPPTRGASKIRRGAPIARPALPALTDRDGALPGKDATDRSRVTDGKKPITVLAVRQSSAPAVVELENRSDYERLLRAWLDTKGANTVRTYMRALGHFSGFLARHLGEDLDSNQATLRRLAELGKGQAQLAVHAWIGAMRKNGVAHRTIMLRVSALRSVLELAADTDVVPWTIKVRLRGGGSEDPAEARIDPKSGREQWLRMRNHLAASDLADDVRDLAILRLMHDCALRRFEVSGIELVHVATDCRRVFILGKGKVERRAISLPKPVVAAMRRWLEIRGRAAGRLFLCPSGISAMMERRRAQLGVDIRPHDLRRLGITRALELTGGDLAKTQHFSRHANTRTVMIYDQRRRDAGGEIAELVADD